MPELRQDPISGRWVIFSPARSARPHDFEPALARHIGTVCPFCEGHEQLSSAEVYALRPGGSPANQPGWQVRVVPNRFPALEVDSGEIDPAAGEPGYTTLPGWGIHEVIVESPRHLTTTTELSAAELTDVLAVYRQRLASLAAIERVRYGLVFKNVGLAAGASLEHLHSQLLGTPIVPSAVVEELTGAEQYFRAPRGVRLVPDGRRCARRRPAAGGRGGAVCRRLSLCRAVFLGNLDFAAAARQPFPPDRGVKPRPIGPDYTPRARLDGAGDSAVGLQLHNPLGTV